MGADPRLVLSVFPGIDLLGMAFEQEGYCLVRGPDVIWGGDIRTFHPPAGVFAGVIGGPPCQLFSRLRYLNPKAGLKHSNLIPEFERCVAEARPRWFLMECVPEAPIPSVVGYVVDSLVLNNRWLGEEQNRLRRFSFGMPDRQKLSVEIALLESSRYSPAVCASGCTWKPMGADGQWQHHRGRPFGDKSSRYLREAIRLQGLPADFDLPGFTVREKLRAVGNGVPLPMGRAIAAAVKRAMGTPAGDAAQSDRARHTKRAAART